MKSPSDLYRKVIDMGSGYIANRVFLQPSIDRMKGEQAENRRQQLMALRDRRKSEKNFK